MQRSLSMDKNPWNNLKNHREVVEMELQTLKNHAVPRCINQLVYLVSTLWYQKATYTNFFLKKTQNRVFETTAETNHKSKSRQISMVFDYLHQAIPIR